MAYCAALASTLALTIPNPKPKTLISYTLNAIVGIDMHFRLGASASQVGINGDMSNLLAIINQLQQKLQGSNEGEDSPSKMVLKSPAPATSMLALEAPPKSVEAPDTTRYARDDATETSAEADDVLQIQRAAARKQKIQAAADPPRPVATPARSHSEVLEKIRLISEQAKEARKPKPLKLGGGSSDSNVSGLSACNSELPPEATESEAGPSGEAAESEDAVADRPQVGVTLLVNSTTHKKEYMRLESSWRLGLSCLWGFVTWLRVATKCFVDLSTTKKRLIDGGKLATNYPGMHSLANGTFKVAGLFNFIQISTQDLASVCGLPAN